MASWKSAVERTRPGWMPRSLSRCPRWVALIGRPGRPPGNSQGEGWPAPVVACPRLPVRSCWVRSATGSGRAMGADPSRILTVVPSMVTWSVVSLLMRATGCA